MLGSRGEYFRLSSEQFSIGGNFEEHVPACPLCSRSWRSRRSGVRGRLRQHATTTAPSSGGGGDGADRSSPGRLRYPLPAVRGSESQTEFTGFDIELVEAIAEKIGRDAGIPGHLVRHDLPRPRAGQVRHGRLGSDDHRRTRGKPSTSPIPTTCSAQAMLVKEGIRHRNGRRPRRQVVGAQQGTTGEELRRRRNRGRGTPELPQGPDAITGPEGRKIDAVVIDRPVAENSSREDRRLEIVEEIPTEEQYGIRGRAGQRQSCSNELNEGLKEVIDDGSYTTIYKKWFQSRPAGTIVDAARTPAERN